MQLKPGFFQVVYKPFLVVRILSTFSMFFHVPIRTGICNKTFSCNLFEVNLHIDSTTQFDGPFVGHTAWRSSWTELGAVSTVFRGWRLTIVDVAQAVESRTEAGRRTRPGASAVASVG